jgi:hypothetical protein
MAPLPFPFPDENLLGAIEADSRPGGVAGAAAELLHVLLIAAGVIVGLGAASLVGLLTWRWRTRLTAARAGHAVQGTVPPLPGVTRAAQPLPKPRPAIERPAVHLHFHGVNAEDVAAIIRQRGELADPPRD